MSRFELPRHIINDIMAHAQSSPADEICGLIGQSAQGYSCYPVENIAGDPQHLYAMDPQKQIESMRAMRENDEELVAIYHSHPSSPALPSATDIQQAQYPDAVYLIISLNTKGVLEMNGFRLRNGDVETLEVIMQGL